MPKVSFVGQSNQNSDSIGANPSRLLNLYPEPTGQGGRTSYLLKPCYGMTEFAVLDGVLIQAMTEVDGAVYVIMPGSFYRVTALGYVLLSVAGITGTAAISRNLNAVTACITGQYLVWNVNTSTLSTPSTGPVATVAWVEYLAGRTIIGEVGTGKFAWSDIADPSVFGGFNFATAEAREDETIRGLVVGNALYLMGSKTTEIWFPSGAGSSAFASSGSVIDRGLKSFGLVCVVEGSIFAVGNDNVVYLSAGNQAQAISNAAVTAAIENGQPESCVAWEEGGHKFAAVTFRDRPAWVYDLATNQWWERSERREAWRCRATAKLGDDWLVGGDDGRVYRLEQSEFDAGEPHYREATSYVLGDRASWFTLAELEVQTEAGFETAIMQLEIGNGVTFGRPIMRALPRVGDFDAQVVFRALGRHKDVVARVSMTGAAVPFYGDCRVRLG